MKTDPKEKCSSCGMTRDAHWGPRYLAASVCTGFVSSGPTVAIPKPLYDRLLHVAKRRGEVVDDMISAALEDWLITS